MLSACAPGTSQELQNEGVLGLGDWATSLTEGCAPQALNCVSSYGLEVVDPESGRLRIDTHQGSSELLAEELASAERAQLEELVLMLNSVTVPEAIDFCDTLAGHFDETSNESVAFRSVAGKKEIQVWRTGAFACARGVTVDTGIALRNALRRLALLRLSNSP